MLGLPTETDEDVLEIARLIREIQRAGARRYAGGMVDIAVSVSTFVPKPHTPFQWVPLAEREVVERRQRLLREKVNMRGVTLSWSYWDDTWLEALLSRGDRRLGAVIDRAWRSGAVFDAWSRTFSPCAVASGARPMRGSIPTCTPRARETGTSCCPGPWWMWG